MDKFNILQTPVFDNELLTIGGKSVSMSHGLTKEYATRGHFPGVISYEIYQTSLWLV